MRILYVTTISLTMNSFFKPHVKMLVNEGNTVDIACNFRYMALDKLYSDLGCEFFQIEFSRSPLSVDNLKAYGQLKKVIENGNYDIVHCHTPNASVITRLVCRKFRKKNGLKVFYTAHGFHFYKGAPKLNWMVYYPVEKICSRYTDKLITINKEDYELANNKFRAKEVHYVPGVGIDLSKFENIQVDRAKKRREIGVPEDAILLTSVGELSKRKNHRIVLQALANVGDKKIHYAIVGKGALLADLQEFAQKYNISNRVHFLGYRTDVVEIYKASDVCCLPSIHEGLPVSLMEAMACGLPVVCSRIRGNVDLINERSGILHGSSNIDELASAINMISQNSSLRADFGKENLATIKAFETGVVLEKMSALYKTTSSL